MSRAPVIDPKIESARLAVLHSYGILDTEPEEEYDKIVREAAAELNMPVAALSLVDANRVWFKAQVGLGSVNELPRNLSICQYAFASSGTTIVPDARADERFAALPLVTQENGFVFYAGVPLRTPHGQSIGTLCVLDHVPRQPTAAELAALATLADRAMALLELRRARRQQSASFPPFPGRAENAAGTARLLVVDDDSAVRDFTCVISRRLGYAVTEAVNGADALSLLETNPGAFDLLLTDVNMPVMDGLQLVKALKKLPAAPRVAVMSGRFDSLLRSTLRNEGVAALVSKPFSIRELELALVQAQATTG